MANSKGCSFSLSCILTNSRLAILILGLFVLTANSMADGVSFDGTTFTGSGEYTEAVNATSNLAVTPDSGGEIAFTQNVVTTGQLSQNGEKLVFAAGTNNSLGTFFMTNAANNGSSMTLNGSLTTTNFYICNKWTNNVYVNEGASLSVSGQAYVNQAKNAQGNIYQSGGTVEFTTDAASGVRIGHYPNTGYPSRYNLSGGTFSVLNTTTYVAWDGYAELNISGGTANLKGISLSNNSSARGQLTVTGGTLNLGSGGVLRNARGAGSSVAPILKLGTATINATESHTWGADMTATLNSGTNTTFNADSGKSITINTVLTGDGALTKTGAGTMTLTGANTYTGGTTISDCQFILSGDGALGTGAVVNNGTLEFAHTGDKNFGNVISGTGSVIKTGSGTLTLTQRSTYSGGTTISAGKVISKAGNASPSAFGTGPIEVAAGATLEFQNDNQLGWGANAPNDITIIGTLIPGTYTHIKNVTLQGGTIEEEYGFKTGGTGLDFGSRTGAITSTGNSTIKSRVNINSGAKATINVISDTLTISGTIKSNGGFTKTGAGTLTLSGENTYTGVTTVSAGTLNITGSAFASRLVVNSGATATIDAGEDSVLNMPADGYNSSVMIGNGSSGSLTLNSGNVTIRNSGSGSYGSIQLGTNSDTTVGELTINGGTMQVDGRILIAANKTGAKGILTINNGQLTLGVPGSYTESGDPACGNLWFGYGTSTVNLNGGTISLFGVKNNGPKDGSTFNFNGGTLQAVADNNASFLTPMGSMKFYVKQGGAIFDTNGYNVKVSAKLELGTDEGDAAGGLTKNGSGTLTLSGANTFTGNIDINQGTVVIAYNAKDGGTTDTATALGNPSVAGRTITVHSGARLETSNGSAGTDVFGGAEAHPLFTIVADGGTIATATDQLTSYGDIELNNGGVFEERGGHSSWYTIFNGDVSVTSGNASITGTGRGISLRGYRDGVNAGVTFDVAKNSTLTVSALLRNSPNSKTVGSFTKKGEGTMVLSNRNNDFTGAIVVDEGILKAQGSWQGGASGTTVFGKNQARTITINEGGEVLFASQDVVSNADNIYPIQFIVNGGTISNEGAVFNNLSNAVFSNGGKIVTTNGNGDWKAFMVNGTTKIAFAGDGNTAESPVVFEVASTATGTALANATICPQTTFEVADITKSDASDLKITAVLANAYNRAGYFTKTGAGTMELAATNVYEGSTTISGGTLALTAPNAVFNSKAIINNSAITTIADQTFRNLSGNGTVTSNDNNLKLITDRSTTFSGTISGVDTLSAEGQGPLNVTGATISTANLEMRQDSVVNVPADNAITVTESFRQGNNAKFTFTGASASVSGSNITTQAAITLNGGTMSFNTFEYQNNPVLTVTNGLALHLDASDASSFDNSSAIKSWKNLANDSNNLYLANINSVSTTAHVTENAKNGLNVVTFPTDGSTSYNLQSAINGVTFFAVMADNGYTSDSAFSFLFGNSGDNNYYFHRGTGTALWNPQYTNGNIKNGSTILNGISVPYNVADIGYDWNVMSLKTSAAVSLTAISRDRNIANRGWHGDVAEILVYTTALSDDDIKAVSQYLATKWQVGTDVIEPSVVTTGEFVSNNAFIVAESSTIDVGAFSKVTLGATTINQDKSLSFNVAENQTTTLNAEITGLGSIVKTGEGALKIYTSSEEQVAVSHLLVSSGRLDMMKFLKGDLEVGKANEPNNTVVFSPGNSVGDLSVNGAVTINGGATLLLEQDASGMDSLTATKFIVSPDAILDLAPTSLQPGATYTLLTQDEDFSDEYNVDFWTSLLSEEDAYIWNLLVVNNMLMATIDPNAVPEPSTWALILLGVGGLLLWRKRK